MKLTRLLLVLLVLPLIVTTPTEANEATLLFDIEIERTAAETRVYLKADGAIEDFRKFELKKDVKARRPDRIYLDIKNMRHAGPVINKQVGTSLSRVRTGLKTDGIRVVFDSSLDELFAYTISEDPGGLLVSIQEPAPEPAVIAPVTETILPEPRAEGDLNLLIVTSDSPEQTEEWLASSADRKSGLEILKTARPDQAINISFLVTGVTSDSNGDFSVVVSFTLLDPNGKLVLTRRRFETTSGRAPAKPAFIMAEPVLDITLGESDPAGEYKIIGIVEDLTNNKTVRTSQTLMLLK